MLDDLRAEHAADGRGLHPGEVVEQVLLARVEIDVAASPHRIGSVSTPWAARPCAPRQLEKLAPPAAEVDDRRGIPEEGHVVLELAHHLGTRAALDLGEQALAAEARRRRRELRALAAGPRHQAKDGRVLSMHPVEVVQPLHLLARARALLVDQREPREESAHRPERLDRSRHSRTTGTGRGRLVHRDTASPEGRAHQPSARCASFSRGGRAAIRPRPPRPAGRPTR